MSMRLEIFMSDAVRRPKRERHRPEESEREILDTAEQLLRERPLSEITVGELMARTRLGRSSFYFYFGDLYDLVARLLARLEAALWEPAERWIEGSEGLPEEDIRRALGGVVSVWVAHGPVLRAIAEASLYDREVASLWRDGVIERFVEAVTDRLTKEISRGRVDHLHARQTATALLLMNERYLMDTLGRVPQADARTVAETLDRIWVRTLYGADGADSPPGL
jgi:TetR/AcrR family transcriptional regulator, ethionamide resistance regulator